MKPLRFRPILKRIRWGGRRLGTVLGKPIGDAADYAESWEVSDHGDDQSVVTDGEYAGWTLERLVRERAELLLGRHAHLSQFPLLVKFLDASDRLSLQVHPNDEQAKTFDPRENGKTEAWIVLDAEPDSRLFAGLAQGIDEERLRAALREGRVESCVHAFLVQRDDCVFIPAGTVHAIGEGILLAEIQQSSDLTFRLHDWGRLGPDGRPRQVHVDEAMQCIDFDRGPVGPVQPRIIRDGDSKLEELVRCPYFVVRRHSGPEPTAIDPDNQFHIVMMLAGNAEAVCGGESSALSRGETMLIPASAPEVRLVPREEAMILQAFLP